MIAFPNAKINLGLNIEARREDGYHNISSCFLPIPFCDILEILPSDKTIFRASGLEIPGDPSGNLCLKAYHLLEEKYHLPPVHIRLHKVIPMGAGLGGGSADGAFTLKLLNDLFSLHLSERQLEEYAAQLGSDCAFFIRNETAIARGRGEVLHPFTLDLSGKWLKLITPGIHVGTAEAYAGVIPQTPQSPIEEVLGQAINEWQSLLVNDFENSIFPNHPEIARIKQLLLDSGALYASMTGSGSAVYGLYDEDPGNISSYNEWGIQL